VNALPDAFFRLCLNKAPRATAAIAASLAALLGLASVAAAAPPPPSGLEVQGGEEAWHPDRSFRLRWENPDGVAAVHYRVRDPLGSVVVEDRRADWPATEVDSILVPDLPGAYLAEVWLEDSAGAEGPPAEARLRFDDARPAAVAPQPAAAWIGRTAFPLTILLERQAASEPLSGLRGFAVSVDGSPDGEPCAAPDRCSEAETDLHGSGNDTFAIADLPEGTSYVHAVAVSGAGIRSASVGSAVLRVDKTDPVVRLSGAPAGWSNRALTLVATASDAGSGMAAGAGGATPFTAIRIDGGRPVVVAGDSVSTGLIAEGTHTVAYYARDLAGNVADGAAVNGVPDAPPATATVRIDRAPPRLSFAAAQDPLEPESIRARVDDDLSGVDGSRGWIGIRRAGSGDAFAPLPAAPAPPGELRAGWDSEAYPAGQYEFEATGYDLAGNAATTTRRAGGAPMVLANPLKTPTAVDAAFGGRTLGRRRCTRRHGRRRCGRGGPFPMDAASRSAAGCTPPPARRSAVAGRCRWSRASAPDPRREPRPCGPTGTAPSPSASPPDRAARCGWRSPARRP
jgi:hypothetical protein